MSAAPSSQHKQVPLVDTNPDELKKSCICKHGTKRCTRKRYHADDEEQYDALLDGMTTFWKSLDTGERHTTSQRFAEYSVCGPCLKANRHFDVQKELLREKSAQAAITPSRSQRYSSTIEAGTDASSTTFPSTPSRNTEPQALLQAERSDESFEDIIGDDTVGMALRGETAADGTAIDSHYVSSQTAEAEQSSPLSAKGADSAALSHSSTPSPSPGPPSYPLRRRLSFSSSMNGSATAWTSASPARTDPTGESDRARSAAEAGNPFQQAGEWLHLHASEILMFHLGAIFYGFVAASIFIVWAASRA